MWQKFWNMYKKDSNVFWFWKIYIPIIVIILAVTLVVQAPEIKNSVSWGVDRLDGKEVKTVQTEPVRKTIPCDVVIDARVDSKKFWRKYGAPFWRLIPIAGIAFCIAVAAKRKMARLRGGRVVY